MRPLLLQQEAVIQNLNQRLNAIRGTDPPEEAKLMERIKESTAEKLVAQSQAQQMNGNGGNGGPGQGQSSWAPHPGQGFAEGPSGQPSRAQMGQMAGQPPHSLQANPMQSSPSLQQAQSQGGHPANQPIVPPRSIPTPQQSGPQQLPGSSPFSGMPPSSMSGSIPFPNSNPQAQPIAGPSQPTMTGGNPMQNTFGIMPLDKHKFDPMFRTFCNRRNVKPDNRLLSIENRPVDLHALHVQVMQEGGINKVEASEVWPIIGGRLGFIQFPGDENTPAKSGPGVATQLGHIYKEYIAPFDQWYIIEAKRAQMAASGDITARMQSNRWTPAQMQAVVSMSQMSVAELHAQHIDEKMIQFVEANRASLQRTFQEQRSFQTRVRSSSQAPGGPQGAEPNGGPGPRPPGMGLNPGFPAGSPAQNGPSMMAARQHMLNQQMAQQQQQHQQQQQPGQQLMGGPHGLPVNRMPQQGGLVARGSMNAALPIIQKMKQDFMANNFNNLPSVEIPPEQLHEYNRILEQVHRQCTEADQRIAMMLGVLRNEEGVRKMVQIVCTVQQQRILLSTTNSPRYIVSLDNLRMMSADLQRIVESSNHQFQQVMRNNPQMFTSNAMMQQQQQQAQQLAQQQQQQQRQQQHQQQPQQQPPQQQQQQMPGNVMVPPNPIMGTPDMSHHNRTAVPHRPPSVVASSPPTTQPLRPPVALPHPPPIKRKPQASNGPVSTPSPAPVQSVSTPVASAPTPTAIASSPPNSTKSPKTKAAPKPKGGAKRRPSKAIPPPAPPAPELSQPTTSSSSGSVKRQREEEPVASGSSATNGSSAAAAASEPSPPKRVKTEWEAQPSEEQRKKEEAIENIKTEPDAQAFFEQMTELFKRSVEDNPQESPSNGFDALDQIFKVVYPGSDSMEMLGEPSGHREPSPPPMMNESFDEFFDFSFGTVEDEDTKAPTPDLVSSSSTNPSPESNHEAEGAHHVPASSSSSTTDIKTEELNDMLRLGPWKEIDGGEATYYQTSDWKWDSPMTSTDPWAIFNS
ncbi:hypothetical protein NLJ89_g5424 [Agrocybe chaxingu]|uniref:ARID domain-containing protein n=1 Tax=Agrocybe chaxingu TaxID=84603 RepID=A0A9W8K0M8_9AGAR|nr:hypothetical protein NLJ89_g5424 [Agrocybe chaxingu]